MSLRPASNGPTWADLLSHPDWVCVAAASEQGRDLLTRLCRWWQQDQIEHYLQTVEVSLPPKRVLVQVAVVPIEKLTYAVAMNYYKNDSENQLLGRWFSTLLRNIKHYRQGMTVLDRSRSFIPCDPLAATQTAIVLALQYLVTQMPPTHVELPPVYHEPINPEAN
jgi:hypothetical protein